MKTAFQLRKSVINADEIAFTVRYDVLAPDLSKTGISELKDLRLAALALVNTATNIANNCSQQIAEKAILCS